MGVGSITAPITPPTNRRAIVLVRLTQGLTCGTSVFGRRAAGRAAGRTRRGLGVRATPLPGTRVGRVRGAPCLCGRNCFRAVAISGPSLTGGAPALRAWPPPPMATRYDKALRIPIRIEAGHNWPASRLFYSFFFLLLVVSRRHQQVAVVTDTVLALLTID